MKKYFWAVLAIILFMSGCKSNVGQTDKEQTVSETQQAAETTSKQTEQTSKINETTTLSEEVSADIAVSREYEFDLEKYQRVYTEKYLLRDKLDFLSDEQYDTYIRAWIFIDNIDYADMSFVPDTSDMPTHWLDENGEICSSYYDEATHKYSPYEYISTYQSFYEYLHSVFTQNAVDEIMSDERFLNIDGELYFKWGEAGGYLERIEGKYELVEKNDSEVVFEYNARHMYDNGMFGYEDGTYIDTTRTIKLVKEGDGWRAELFHHLIRLTEDELRELNRQEKK